MANNGWFRLDPNYTPDSKKPSPPKATPAPPSPSPPSPPRPADPVAKPAPAKAPPAPPPREGSMNPQITPPPPTIQSGGKPQIAAPPPTVNPGRRPAPVMGKPPAPVPSTSSSELEPWDTTAKHSQTVGKDGPVVLHDTKLHETLETFANQKIPERVVHVKGWGAFGYFQTTNAMADYTKALLFQKAGAQVPVTTRFSLAVSTKGTPDTGRNVRGFSTKFYTNDGVFDLLCNHIPVFSVRDAIRFPDSIDAFLPNPANNLVDPNRFWGFVARSPESINFVSWLYSDRGTIKSLRQIHGYSVNTYVWRNEAGKRHYVKYQWVPLAGEQHIDRAEAGRLAAQNPDLCGQDLFDTIAKGTPVEYQLCVQLMDPADSASLPFDPLDCTKVWDEELYPLMPVGRLVLNKNPQNFMEQVEKVAFSPANLMEGIELSNDKMLEGRSFIYFDAQRHRLGADFRKIPINKQPDFTPAQLPDTGIGQLEQGTQQRAEIDKTDDFYQAGERYRSLDETEQGNLVSNIAVELPSVSKEIQATVLGYLQQADPEFAARVAEEMKQNS